MDFTELKKRYKSTQTKRNRAKLKEKAASDRKRCSPNDSNFYIERIGNYEREQAKGFAILHRINALRVLGAKDASGSDSKTGDPPAYVGSTIDEMISTLRLLYREHLQTLQNMLAWQPRGAHAGEYREFEFLIGTYNKNGQTLAWEEHAYACAMRGGCCGRQCGCCSRPLQELYIPLSNGRRRKGAVYGHCTAECLCCNLFYGCYKPDSRLPEIDPDLLMAVAG